MDYPSKLNYALRDMVIKYRRIKWKMAVDLLGK